MNLKHQCTGKPKQGQRFKLYPPNKIFLIKTKQI